MWFVIYYDIKNKTHSFVGSMGTDEKFLSDFVFHSFDEACAKCAKWNALWRGEVIYTPVLLAMSP